MDWFDDAVPPPPPRPKFLKARLEERASWLTWYVCVYLFLGSDLVIKTYPLSPRFRHHQVELFLTRWLVRFSHIRGGLLLSKKNFHSIYLRSQNCQLKCEICLWARNSRKQRAAWLWKSARDCSMEMDLGGFLIWRLNRRQEEGEEIPQICGQTVHLQTLIEGRGLDTRLNFPKMTLRP